MCHIIKAGDQWTTGETTLSTSATAVRGPGKH